MSLPSPQLAFPGAHVAESREHDLEDALRAAEQKIQEMDRQFAEQVSLELERYRVEQVEPQIDRLHSVIRSLETVAKQQDDELVQTRAVVQELRESQNHLKLAGGSSAGVACSGAGGPGGARSRNRSRANSTVRSGGATPNGHVFGTSICSTPFGDRFAGGVGCDSGYPPQFEYDRRSITASSWRARLLKRCCFLHWKTWGRKCRIQFHNLAHSAVRYSYHVMRKRALSDQQIFGTKHAARAEGVVSAPQDEHISYSEANTPTDTNYFANFSKTTTTSSSPADFDLDLQYRTGQKGVFHRGGSSSSSRRRGRSLSESHTHTFALAMNSGGDCMPQTRESFFSCRSAEQHAGGPSFSSSNKFCSGGGKHAKSPKFARTVALRRDACLQLHALCLLSHHNALRTRALFGWRQGVLVAKAEARHEAYQLDLRAQENYVSIQMKRARAQNRKAAVTFANVRDFLRLKNVFSAWMRFACESREEETRKTEFLEDMRDRLSDQSCVRNVFRRWELWKRKAARKSARAQLLHELLFKSKTSFVGEIFQEWRSSAKKAKSHEKVWRVSDWLTRKTALREKRRRWLGVWRKEVLVRAESRVREQQRKADSAAIRRMHLEFADRARRSEVKCVLVSWRCLVWGRAAARKRLDVFLLKCGFSAWKQFAQGLVRRKALVHRTHCVRVWESVDLVFALWRMRTLAPVRKAFDAEAKFLRRKREVLWGWKQQSVCSRAALRRRNAFWVEQVLRKQELCHSFSLWRCAARIGDGNGKYLRFTSIHPEGPQISRAMLTLWSAAAKRTKLDRTEEQFANFRMLAMLDRRRQALIRNAFNGWASLAKEVKQIAAGTSTLEQARRTQEELDRLRTREKQARRLYLKVALLRSDQELSRYFFHFWSSSSREAKRVRDADAEDRRLVSTFRLAKAQARRPFLKLLHDDIVFLNLRLVFVVWKGLVELKKMSDSGPPRSSPTDMALQLPIAAHDDCLLLQAQKQPVTSTTSMMLASPDLPLDHVPEVVQEPQVVTVSAFPPYETSTVDRAGGASHERTSSPTKIKNVQSEANSGHAAGNHRQENEFQLVSLLERRAVFSHRMAREAKERNYQRLVLQGWLATARRKRVARGHAIQLNEFRDTTLQLVADIVVRDATKKSLKKAFEGMRMLRTGVVGSAASCGGTATVSSEAGSSPACCVPPEDDGREIILLEADAEEPSVTLSTSTTTPKIALNAPLVGGDVERAATAHTHSLSQPTTPYAHASRIRAPAVFSSSAAHNGAGGRPRAVSTSTSMRRGRGQIIAPNAGSSVAGEFLATAAIKKPVVAPSPPLPRHAHPPHVQIQSRSSGVPGGGGLSTAAPRNTAPAAGAGSIAASRAAATASSIRQAEQQYIKVLNSSRQTRTRSRMSTRHDQGGAGGGLLLNPVSLQALNVGLTDV